MTWARHPGDSKFHHVAIADTASNGQAHGSTVTTCDGRWPAGDVVELDDDPPAIDRCGQCKRLLSTNVRRASVADFDMGDL